MIKVSKRAILPAGFKANAVKAGIKRSGKLDLALFYSQPPAKAACQFTTNKIQAAPLKLNKIHLKRNTFFKAIIVNSGNANSFTGKAGLKDAQGIAISVAKGLKIMPGQVLVNSTGIIARRLPVGRIKRAMPDLIKGLSRQGINKAKIAIQTTDKIAKEISVKFKIGEKTVTICAVAKGAGMIAPNLATMLCFILTDAHITQAALNKALGLSVDKSFNCITVDGCMSTNDSVMLLANAQARNALIAKGNNFNLFVEALNIVCLELAKAIIKDAEGASKFIEIKVEAAKNFAQARKAALSVANSNLFKTAMYGKNPNFGRIVSGVGASGIDVKEEGFKIRVSPLEKKEIKVNVSLGRGNACATVYTSDLTPEYIKINAEYN